MMKNIKTIGTIISGLFFAQTTFAQHGLLWRIEGHGHTGFVYGTMHTGDSIANSMDSTVYNALNQCHTMLLEADMGSIPDPTQLFQLMKLPQGKLSDAFSPQDWIAVSAYLEERLDPMVQLMKDELQPIFLLIMLQAQEEAERTHVARGEFLEEAMDMRLHRLATANKMETLGLEKWSEQIQAMGKIPLIDQANMMLQMVSGQKISNMMLQDIVGSYYDQDLTQMLSEMDLSDPLQRKFFDAVLFERNALFVERSLPYFERDATFMAIGALHLAGDRGVLELFRQKGFHVANVPFTFLNYKSTR